MSETVTKEEPEKKQVARPVRRARLRLSRIDPWSMMKTSFLFAVAGLIVILVATALLWGVISASGVMNQLQEALNALLSNTDGSGAINVRDYIDFPRVMGLSLLMGAINVILITAIATLGAFLYNVSSTLLGGIEVTLSEE